MSKPIRTRHIFACLIFGSMPLSLIGCATVAPALAALGVAFGQDLMASAAVNYTPRYAMQTEVLLNSMATQLTGVQMQPQLAQYGYQPPPPKYIRKQQEQSGQNPYGDPYGNNAYGNPYGSNPYGNDPYASNDPYAQNYPQGSPYAQGAPAGQTDPYAQQGDPYAQSGSYGQQPGNPYGQNDPYANQGQNDPYAQQGDPYGQSDPYAQQGYGQNDPYAQSPDPYGQGDPRAQQPSGYPPPDPYSQPGTPYNPNDAYASRSGEIDAASISLDAALFVRRAGASVLEQIKDGDVLKDGRGNPAAGDVIKVHFAANCACFVYVIGIDATGYVAQIYPDPEAQHTNPVQPNAKYRLPEGNEWWGLDEYRGIEQVYFITARERLTDIENALAQLASAPRRTDVAGYQPVRTPAIFRTTRGLVKVSLAEPVEVGATGAAPQQIAPTNYLLDAAANALVVTRWFDHR